jgi:chromosomal replication initiator protein
VSLPRQIGMFLSRKLTKHSFEEIGRFFGNRDHTTVIYAVQKIEARIAEDRRFRETVDALVERLR